MPHLRVVGRRRTRGARRRSRARLVSASTRFGVVRPARSSMPWTPRNSRSTCSVRSAATATGPDEGVGRRAHAAGEDDGQVVAVPGVVQQLGHRDGVGDDGEVGDVAQLVRDRVGRRARRDGDRGAGLDQLRRGAAAIAYFCDRVQRRLDLEARARPRCAAADQVAPPWTRATRPFAASSSMSRRTVMSETPRMSTSSETREPPWRSTSCRIRSCR